MTEADVQAWLDRYVEAWRSNDAATIRELFSEDARYRYHAYDEWVEGRDAIVASWLESPDDPAGWDARYEPWLVAGEQAVAVGTSRYVASGDTPARNYWNCFLLRLGTDGRCAEFTEYYVREPAAEG